MPGLLSFLPSRTQESRSYLCSVHFLDLSDPISVTYHRNTKGNFLIEHVSNSIDVAESGYFGLKYLDNNKLECWLDPTKSVYSQLKGVVNPVFNFRVKFYPSNPDVVKDNITRYQLYLQVHKDFEEGRLICTLKDALVLSAYIVQGELGDYEYPVIKPSTPPNTAFIALPNIIITTPTPTSNAKSTFIETAATTTNNTISTPCKQKIDYVGETRLPESLNDFQKEIEILHKKLQGMDPETCEDHFLRKASTLNSYGLHPYVVADMESKNVYLTLTPRGVVIFEDNIAITLYQWQDVKKTSFDGKLFYVKSYVKERGVPKEDKEETTTVAYRMTSSKACKHLWKNSVAHQLFFTLKDSDEAPKVVQSGGFLSRRSKFRYSGKCLSEMYKHSVPTPKPVRRSYNTSFSPPPSKYATLPKAGRMGKKAGKMNVSDVSDEMFEGSEEENSLLNKTATSIVLNYLESTKNNNNPSKCLVKRSNTDTVTSNTVTRATKPNMAQRPTTLTNISPATTSDTHPQNKSISTNLSNTTKSLASVTNRLKKFILQNATKITDNSKHNNSERTKQTEEKKQKNSIFEDPALSHDMSPTLPLSTNNQNNTSTFASNSIYTYPLSNSSNESSTYNSPNFYASPYIHSNETSSPSSHLPSHSYTPTSNPPSSPNPLSTLASNNLNKKGLIDKLKQADNINCTNIPTTLSTSTFVTTTQSTHSSVHANNPFDKNITVAEKYKLDKTPSFNDTYHFVDQTIERSELILENRDQKQAVKVDTSRNAVFDGNDTGYLSGSDAFNHSFEGAKTAEIKDFFKREDINCDNPKKLLKQGQSNSTLTNSYRDLIETKPLTSSKKSSREELLNLLTYESQLMQDRLNIKQNNQEKQVTDTKEQLYNKIATYYNNKNSNDQERNSIDGFSKKSGYQNDFQINETSSPLTNFPPTSISPNDDSPSTSDSNKCSTVVTPDSREFERPEDNNVSQVAATISSYVDQAAPDSMGVLSNDNFERIKEIRKLLQENKDKIQEIRENIDTEIRNAFEDSSEDFPPNYKLCYGDGLTDEEQSPCGGVTDCKHDIPSEDEDYIQFQDAENSNADEEDEHFDENIRKQKEYDSEDTIFIDHNYKSIKEDKQLNNMRGDFKPKQIAFSTKHYEWYGENGMSSGGGGVIYTFSGASESRCPSDQTSVRSTPVEDEDICKDGSELKDRNKERRKSSMGRSISSIEGFYSADNVVHYNPYFDDKNMNHEVHEQNTNEFELVEKEDTNEFKLVEKEDDSRNEKKNKIGIEDKHDIMKSENIERGYEIYPDEDQSIAFITSKVTALEGNNANMEENIISEINEEIDLSELNLKHLNIICEPGSAQIPKQVTFDQFPTSFQTRKNLPQPINKSDCEDISSTLDLLTFDKILQKSEQESKSPFCRILTSKPDASEIKNRFDKLNAEKVSGTSSVSKFADDLDVLDNKIVVEDIIMPKKSVLLYENTVLKKDNDYSEVHDLKSEIINPADDKKESASGGPETDSEVTKPQTEGRKNSCFCTLLSSSLVAIAFFTVAMVLLFETNQDKEYLENFTPVRDFRNSVYDPYRQYIVCSIKKRLPEDFVGLD